MFDTRVSTHRILHVTWKISRFVYEIILKIILKKINLFLVTILFSCVLLKEEEKVY